MGCFSAVSQIKTLCIDVDGTLTDGKIVISQHGELCKSFNVKDGLGITFLLPQLGIVPVVITGRTSKIVKQRCAELQITDCFMGVKDKLSTLLEYCKKRNISLSECAYIGDDLNDFDCMMAINKKGGFTACPCDAVPQIKKIAQFISSYKGGEGAVRDLIDNLAEM